RRGRARRGPTDLRRPVTRPRDPRGHPRRAVAVVDAHRVRAARAVPAASQAGARTLVHPRGGLGLRLPDDGQLTRGIRRLRPPQARVRGRTPTAAYRAGRRIRPARDTSVIEPLHRALQRITGRMSLCLRVAVLTSPAVAVTLSVVSAF